VEPHGLTAMVPFEFSATHRRNLVSFAEASEDMRHSSTA